jgi:hypothetical protein
VTLEDYAVAIEDYFQQERRAGLFLLSPSDFRLIEKWHKQGVPLDAVLRGILTALERARPRKVNSLAYCEWAVLEEAQYSPPVPEGSAKATSA